MPIGGSGRPVAALNDASPNRCDDRIRARRCSHFVTQTGDHSGLMRCASSCAGHRQCGAGAPVAPTPRRGAATWRATFAKPRNASSCAAPLLCPESRAITALAVPVAVVLTGSCVVPQVRFRCAICRVLPCGVPSRVDLLFSCLASKVTGTFPEPSATSSPAGSSIRILPDTVSTQFLAALPGLPGPSRTPWYPRCWTKDLPP